MEMSDRSATDEVYVAGFVPCYQLPHKRSCCLDPFLHPLISEIEDIFIDGISMIMHAACICDTIILIMLKKILTP